MAGFVVEFTAVTTSFFSIERGERSQTRVPKTRTHAPNIDGNSQIGRPAFFFFDFFDFFESGRGDETMGFGSTTATGETTGAIGAAGAELTG